MAIWVNVKEARHHLLEKGFVYTLRPKLRREGRDMLCWNGFGKKGMGAIKLVKEIEDTDELKEFVKKSGFNSIADWLEKAKESRFLFRLELISLEN